jgi:hypothetical protein
VEQLAEGQPEQGEDDGDRVEDGEEAERVALQPGVARGQHQSGDAHREEQEQREDVLGELLRGRGPVVHHPAAEGDHHPGDDEERGPDQAVEEQEGGERLDRERPTWNPKRWAW